jgi:allantoate deiminase
VGARTDLKNRAEEVVARCRKLAEFSEDAGGIRRTFLSAPMRDCHREIARWLGEAGAVVSVDAVGNLRGVYSGAEADAPRLMIGSHLDTVPNAGAYDGVLGVMIGIALLEMLEGRKFPFGVEVVGFSEEEGVRFGTPFIGSRALVGRMDDQLLDSRDSDGVSIRTAIENFGLQTGELPRAIVKEDALAYLEFHIEQGPVLESLGLALAAVDAIAAQNRLEFVFTGHSNHAGTTPMHLRRDAVAGAAEFIMAVEETAKNTAGLVATVGQIEAKPGAVNVIAGAARVSLDVRHGSDEICERTTSALIQKAEEIATRRGLGVKRRELLKQNAVRMDAFLVSQIEKAMQDTGCPPHRMVSGAGHDAMIVAEKVPSAMIFLRSPGGISHDPAEAVNVEDVEKALECGLQLLEQLAQSPEFLKRMCRA